MIGANAHLPSVRSRVAVLNVRYADTHVMYGKQIGTKADLPSLRARVAIFNVRHDDTHDLYEIKIVARSSSEIKSTCY